ncbi:MAG: PDZ domain-containing protein, partial [Pricia sp.]
MKRNLAYALVVMLISVASCSFTNKSFENDDKDKLLLDLITYVLEKGHYEPKNIDDDFSVSVFDDFIDVIDPTKRYFLKEDIEEFEQFKFQIDDQIKSTDISFFNLVYERLMQRMEEAEGIYKEVLDTPFDYSEKESIDIDYEELPFAASKEDLRERWRQQLKYATLGTYDSKVRLSNEDAETKKSGEKGDVVEEGETIEEEEDEAFEEDVDNTDEPMTPEEAEVSARKSTKKTLDEFFDFVGDLERKDWFVQYINTIVDEFDPHTYYLAPNDKEKFDMSMSGKFEGIGARLQKKPEGAKIVDIISGGPVWLDGQLEVGDEILKVGQEGEDPINIVGMRLDDAIKLIKGPKGTI